jgi:hypothetical protein
MIPFLRSLFHVLLHFLTQRTVIIPLFGCVGTHAMYSCASIGPGELLSCMGQSSHSVNDMDQNSTSRKSKPATLLRMCLLDRLPFPFVTSAVKLTLQLPYNSSDMIHCHDPRCTTTARWNAVLHHPEQDAIVSKSYLYKNGADG